MIINFINLILYSLLLSFGLDAMKVNHPFIIAFLIMGAIDLYLMERKIKPLNSL